MIRGRVADMWRYLTDLRVLGMKVRPDQHHAMQRLERSGKRFLVDFGTDNAVRLAKNLRWPGGGRS